MLDRAGKEIPRNSTVYSRLEGSITWAKMTPALMPATLRYAQDTDCFFWDHFNQFGFMTMHLINPGQTESTKVSVCLRLLILKSKPKMEGSLFLLKWKCLVSIRYFILLTLKCFIKTEKLGLFPTLDSFDAHFDKMWRKRAEFPVVLVSCL